MAATVVATLTRSSVSLLGRLEVRLVVVERIEEATCVLTVFMFTREPPSCLKSCNLVIRGLQLSIGFLQRHPVVVHLGL